MRAAAENFAFAPVRFTGADGLDLAGEQIGAGAPVLFLHGGGQTRRSWRSGAQAAAAAGYRAIAIDQRGHGDSAWSPTGDYSPEAFGRDTAEIAKALGEPVVLVGASRGGQGAIAAAATLGAGVRALVLVEITPKIDKAGADQVRDFMRATASGFNTVEEAARAVAVHMKREHGGDPERLRRSMREGDDGRLYWRWDPAIVTRPEDWLNVEKRLEAAIGVVTAPILLVRGSESTVVREEHARHLQTHAPHAEVVTVAGAGHMVSGDQNTAFNEAILAFLRRCVSPHQ